MRARDAVHAALDFEAIGQSLRERDWSVVHVRSAAGIGPSICVAPSSGAVSAVFVPVFSEYAEGDRREFARIVSGVATCVLLILLAVSYLTRPSNRRLMSSPASA